MGLDTYRKKRDRFRRGLEATPLRLLPCPGTYFQCVDLPASGIVMPDRDFADMAVHQAGVAIIPLSPFYES